MPEATLIAARYASQTYDDPLSPGLLLEMQTINPAAAARMDAELVSLDVGKRADIVVRSALARVAPDRRQACLTWLDSEPR